MYMVLIGRNGINFLLTRLRHPLELEGKGLEFSFNSFWALVLGIENVPV